MEKEQEIYNDLYDVVERGSYFNAYVMNENNERREEVSDIKTAMSELDKLDDLEKINSINSEDNLESMYKDLSQEDLKKTYKDLYEKQENIYLYKIDNDIFNDKVLSQQYLDNSQKLNYLEENIVDTTTKYELQAEVKNDLFNENKYEQKIENSSIQSQELTEQLYKAKHQGLDTNDIENDLFNNMANKKLYTHNQNFINKHSEELTDINNKEQKRLNNRKEQSKSLDNLYSKDIMWKIVQEQEKNSVYLKSDDYNVLDARANANTIMQQKSKQQMAKTSSTQVLRNKSYNNAYTSLDNSKRVNNTNHVQDEENQERDKNEKQERNSKNKGITR